MVHWRPSEKVNWQRSGNWFVSIGFSMKKGKGGMALVSGSCTVVICNVIVRVNQGQWLTMWITTGPVENVARRQSRSYRECRLPGVGSAASETRFILPSGVQFLSSSEVNGNGSGLRHF